MISTYMSALADPTTTSGAVFPDLELTIRDWNFFGCLDWERELGVFGFGVIEGECLVGVVVVVGDCCHGDDGENEGGMV